MAQKWVYYVPLLVHNGESGVGFTFRFAPFEQQLTEELAWAAIIQWTEEITGIVPQDKDHLPVVALGWTLLYAKRGPGVPPLQPKGNGREN